MSMRLTAKAAFAFVCFIGPALAQSDDSDAPIVFHKNGITERLHNRVRPIRLKQYPKVTYLDEAFSFACHSESGCIVTFTAEIALSGFDLAAPCAYVDGVPMEPFCGPSGEQMVYDRQGQRVAQGTHTFQFGIKNDETVGPEHACPCEYDFTFYDDAS